jgi:virulence factor Mce-like protein
METRVPHLRTVLAPAAFAFVCIALTVTLLHAFGGSVPLESRGYRIVIPVREAASIVPGSGVQIAGVTVGHVVSLQRTGNAADVTVELQPRYAPLRSRATAITRTKTLLGEGYIEIAPGPLRAPPIPDGGRLSPGRARPSVALDEFLATFDPATRARIRNVFAGLAAALHGRAQALNSTVASAAPLSSSLRDIVHALDGQRRELRALIASSAGVLHAIGERQGLVRAAVAAGDEVLSVTARRNRDLAATVRGLPPLMSELRRTSTAVAAASPALNRAVASLLPAAPRVAPALDALSALAPQLTSLFDELGPVLRAGRRGLPALSSVLRATHSGLRRFYPTSRELIPLLALFARTRPALAILANVANIAGTYVGPGGVVVEYGSGVPTFWNETISGWKSKLPTNRQNPYPKPPYGLLDTGRIGVLKSYDCRHLGNPLYLPPTGLGAPPCILQGPWTFDGKRAFYPRLTLAPP